MPNWFSQLFGPSPAAVRKRLLSALQAGADDAAFDEVGRLTRKARVDVLFAAARHLMLDDEDAAATRALRRLLQDAPEHLEAQHALASLAVRSGDLEAALAAAAAHVAANPRNLIAACQLSRVQLEAGQLDAALDTLGPFLRAGDLDATMIAAQIHFAAGRLPEAGRLAAVVRDEAHARQAGAMTPDEFQFARERFEEATRLADDVAARLHGREQVIVEPARKGTLDARAGVNYRLLAESLMAESRHRPAAVGLRSVEALAVALSDHDPRDAWAVSTLGEWHLREGRVDDAHARFEAARALDGQCFAALLGLGAAVDARRTGFPKSVSRLPEPTALAELDALLAALLPDFAAFTPLERRIVRASAAPVQGVLPRLVEAGVRAYVLALDARPTDLPEFAEFAGERTDDHRTAAAIGGLATHRAFVLRIDELLDLGPESGLTFAHELAHAVLFHLPESWRARVEALHARAQAVGYAFTQYQLENPDELWAVGYADWLGERWGLAPARPNDEAGLRAELAGLFVELEAGAV
jgi:predicted Zn-dependent protease